IIECFRKLEVGHGHHRIQDCELRPLIGVGPIVFERVCGEYWEMLQPKFACQTERAGSGHAVGRCIVAGPSTDLADQVERVIHTERRQTALKRREGYRSKRIAEIGTLETPQLFVIESVDCSPQSKVTLETMLI